MKKIMRYWMIPAALCALAGCSQNSASNHVDVATQHKLYMANCGTCHMEDGSGVPSLQPPLKDNTLVAGSPDTLIKIVLLGPAKVLPADRPVYSNTMPPQAQLSDADLAAILTYVRREFGGGAMPVTPADIAAARRAKP